MRMSELFATDYEFWYFCWLHDGKGLDAKTKARMLATVKFRRTARTLSRPAPVGFRERRIAPFRVRAQRQPCSPPHPSNAPQACGLRPRPRKPTAPRAAGHERALRATRNSPPPHIEARNRFAHLSIFKSLPTPFREMRIQCGILFRLSLRSATTLASLASVTSLAFATKNTRASRATKEGVGGKEQGVRGRE